MAKDWLKIKQTINDSGLSAEAYCRKHGIKIWTYYAGVRVAEGKPPYGTKGKKTKLSKVAKTSKPTKKSFQTFAPVDNQPIEIKLTNGATIKVQSIEQLKEILEAINL